MRTTIWKNEHNFCTLSKSSTVSIIGIVLVFFEGNMTRVMNCLISKTDYFQVLSKVHCLFSFVRWTGEEGYCNTTSFFV